jgi:hypothetical protein
MKEADLRKWHRRMGLGLALFFVIQAGTGLLISFGEWSPSHSHANSKAHELAEHHEEQEASEHGSLGLVHHGGGAIGFIYRVLVGTGIIGMAVSGTIIFIESRARVKKT